MSSAIEFIIAAMALTWGMGVAIIFGFGFFALAAAALGWPIWLIIWLAK